MFPIYVVLCTLRPPCGERHLLLVRFRARRNYNNQYQPFFEKTSTFRFKTAFSDWNSPSPILPLKCSISGKTGLSDSNLYDEGRSGKFEQFDQPTSVSDLNENILYKELLIFLRPNLYPLEMDSLYMMLLQIWCFFIVRSHRQSVAKFPSTLD